MSEWNAERYLKFKKQRTQPAIDLAMSVRNISPKSIVDVGCGPGNSTEVLTSVFQNAKVLGIDNSPEMIEKARKSCPDISFELKSANELEGSYDLIFSNACLQWISDHKMLIPFLMSHLNENGALAVQVPMNSEEPFYRIADEAVKGRKWNFDSLAAEKNGILSPEEYFDILSACSRDFDIWEKVYYHPMPSCRAILEWVKGTRLRPYLNALNDKEAAEFEGYIEKQAEKVYSKMQNGEYIFKFKRLFFVAYK